MLCTGAALQPQILPNPVFPGFDSQGKLVCPLLTWPRGRGDFSAPPLEEPPNLCPGAGGDEGASLGPGLAEPGSPLPLGRAFPPQNL